MGAQVYQKQINRHTLRELVPVESYDEATGLFTTSDNYLGFGFVSRPLPGCDSSVTQCLNVLLTFDYPKESFIQVMLMGSQDIDRTLDCNGQVKPDTFSDSLPIKIPLIL